jgi:alpha-tubulin suppressor-like RCC1 family protein
MSMRFTAAINKPGFNPLGAQTAGYTYYLNSWGTNAAGQLGIGSNTNSYSSPKQAGSLTDWLQVSGGYRNSAAVKTDGTLWTWGDNQYGQLGLGNRTYYSSPKQVGALTSWAKVSAGFDYVMAIKADGTLWSWGRGNYGLLGLGNLTAYSSPKQVGALTNWSSVSAGSDHNIAVKTDGTAWSWGYNANGQLGVGNITNRSSPTQIGLLTNWASVNASKGAGGSGTAFGMAIKTDGTLWGWGYGGNGQLGTTSLTTRSSPIQVGALTNWLKITANGYTSASIKTDGTLWTWGYGNNGQLGDGTSATKSSPVQVGLGTTWSEFSAGSNGNVLATKTDKTLWGWGANSNGELGLNNRTAYSSPKQIGAGSLWSSPQCGYSYTLALKV